jgi:hypothetical protein
VLGKSTLKLVSSFFSIVLLGGLLTSCGASAEEKALKANCDKIFSNLKKIGERPEIFRNSDVADDETVAILLGEETRKDVEKKIIAKYPFLDEIIVAKEKGNQFPDSYYYAGSIFIIAEALKGTDIEFPYTREQMLVITTQENAWRDVVDPLANKIFGDSLDSEINPGCIVIDQSRKEENPNDYLSNFDTSTEFAQASSDYLDFADFLQVIRNCEATGWHWTDKCAKEDYVSKPSTYTPSNEPTQEELEILAEREADAEREALNPSGSSGYSNVTPLQLCGSLGAVVQTENYGQLTCKYVFINRVRALAWMR